MHMLLAALLASLGGASLESASSGEFSIAGCRAKWGESRLEVSNQDFCRVYHVANDGTLRTVSFRGNDGKEWIKQDAIGKIAAAEGIRARAFPAKWSPVGVVGLRVEVSDGTVIDVYPDVPGVIERRKSSEELQFDEKRIIRSTAITCLDQTDIRDTLLDVDEHLWAMNDKEFSCQTSLLDLRDVLTRQGVALLRLAPMPTSRPGNPADFEIHGSKKKVTVAANGYPLVSLVYSGGDAGRKRALTAIQRALRPYREGRDGIFLSNTWGGGNRDGRICEEFLLKEIDAGAKMGVDVIQVDDGWQLGRTKNSNKRALPGREKLWNGYWDAQPDFWKEDLERFPSGIGYLAKKAAEKGMRLGLWYGPDSIDDARNWEKDAACLLDYHRRYGIDYFKIDSMKLHSPLALKRNRKMFDKMLNDSKGAMVFDLDCTAEVRPGFLGLVDIGPVFVENRYASRGAYYPHHTLKNLWDLAHVMDLVRLRMEFCNPDTEHDKYNSPLAPSKYRPDALFATVMAGSPLGWLELSEVTDKSAAEIGSLVKVWKRERSVWYSGSIHPIGERPDGVSWTGFVSESKNGNAGYVLLFRELSGDEEFALDLRDYFVGRGIGNCEVISGRGKVSCNGKGKVVVSIPEKLDYCWAKLSLVP